jgi:hypothetical protein
LFSPKLELGWVATPEQLIQSDGNVFETVN